MIRIKLQSIYIKVDKVFQETVGFRLLETSFAKVVGYLYRERDPSSLGITRMLFGLTMLLDIPEERGGSTMDRRWGDPRDCHFPLLPFLRPLLMPHMALVYITMWLGALGVTLGYRYRLSAVAFAASYWYILLVEKSFWNNHSYLFGLVALLLSTTQANHYMSVDAYVRPSLREQPVPQWNYSVLKYQFFILYFVAGVKKGSAEWLSGYAMTSLSKHWVFHPFRVFLTAEQTDLLVVHWFAFVFDLTVAFWMSWRRTRTLAVLFCAAFHLMNSRLFTIGMFPWVCLATMPLFYPVDWPRRVMAATRTYSQMILRKIAQVKQIYQKEEDREDATGANEDKDVQKHAEVDKKAPFKQNINENNHGVERDKKTTRESRKRQLVTCSILIYMIVQAFLPFSHFITKGYNNWTNGLYGYSWDMMVYSWDTILVVVKIVDNDKQREHYLQPGAWTPNDRWTRHGDMIHQYAHCIKRNVIADIGRNGQACEQCGGEALIDWDKNLKTHKGPPPNISMYIDVWCSMNGRFQQRMFDPKVDLLQAKWSPFAEVEWLMPLLTDYNHWREMLAEIRREVKSWNSNMDATFVADFPGHHLKNFIEPELTNVTLTVLDGQVLYEPAVLQSEYKSLDEGFSVRLAAGESAPIFSNQFHTVHAIGDAPACYVYTFKNNTRKIYTQNVTAGVTTEKLPVWKEISSRAKNMMTFFKLVGASLLQIFFGDSYMPIRVNHSS